MALFAGLVYKKQKRARKNTDKMAGNKKTEPRGARCDLKIKTSDVRNEIERRFVDSHWKKVKEARHFHA